MMSMTQEDKQLQDITVKDLMISSEKVAHVQLNNPLEHALLVLVKSGYFAVPVLDASYKLAGSISKTVILDQILGIERFEVERLAELKVHEVMKDEMESIQKNASFIDGLKAVIDAPFVCVVDEEGYFDGILTRRAILKALKRDYYRREKA
ncbi:CBS domain protein [Pseudogracilibacillus auburnensis]|uniref:CBS domain protein n=2 Tax=Pseudogracilibacillus auburnensis TaxID=1494959 RepID=A0A2V3W586_9BACI|nr:CBS domain protein [Pseudogracilibacillus auburnensis]